jgi:hypothetical protein
MMRELSEVPLTRADVSFDVFVSENGEEFRRISRFISSFLDRLKNPT